MTIDLAALTGRNNYYEDFNLGDVYEHARGKTVEGLENVLITNLVLNTAQAHFNEHLAASLPQQHRITFGGVTASLVIGLAMQDTGENAVEEVALDKVRFRVPVLHGDTLYAFTEVLAKTDDPAELRGHQNVGLVHFRHWGVNQRGETVFEGERKTLIKKRAFTTEGLAVDEEPAKPALRPPTRAGSVKPSARAVRRRRATTRKAAAMAPSALAPRPRGGKVTKRAKPARSKTARPGGRRRPR
ncbi:MAG TPA: MaoC family dehydratase [Candidatus Binataceae bacterium]|jgi:acyl dehydratase|nr:MaoC family dehydratase [Candidatus Binataceae bacterium]